MTEPAVEPAEPAKSEDSPNASDSAWRLKEMGWAAAAWAALIGARALLEAHLWGMLVLGSMLVLAQLLRGAMSSDPRIVAMDRPTLLRHALLTSGLVLAIVYTALVVGRATLPSETARLLEWFGPSLAEMGAG